MPLFTLSFSKFVELSPPSHLEHVVLYPGYGRFKIWMDFFAKGVIQRVLVLKDVETEKNGEYTKGYPQKPEFCNILFI